MTVAIRDVGHTYSGSRQALDGVDLEVGTGIFGLLGPNGAGKTTLMRILATLLRPTRGRAQVDGHDVVAEPGAVRSRLGYLPQEFGAWRRSRVAEALDLLASLSGVRDRGRRRRRVEETLEAVGLTERADSRIGQLSGGMVRRVGLAQALVHDPAVLILDEPTVGLDPQERVRFRATMAELARRRTVILSTHLVAGLDSICSDLALLDRGRIAFRGSPATLREGARGRVFQVVTEDEALLPAVFQVVSREASDGQTRLRGVTAEEPPPGAEPVAEPTLEEAYLATLAG